MYLIDRRAVSLTETDLPALILDALYYVFEQYRTEVSLLNTNAEVIRVDHLLLKGPNTYSLHDTIAVSVTVNVGTKTSNATLADRNVTQYHSVHNVISTNITEVFSVVRQFEDIVIALNQDLIAVQPIQDRQALAIDHNITQVIDLIVGPNSFVPTLHHIFVHFVCIVPGTHRRAIVVGELTNVLVTKVRVAGQKNCWHE